MADNKINVGGRLHSIATGNILAGADEILDDDKGKKQSEINTDVDNALADRYTKDETYNRTELNNLITTPDVQYVTVVATEQTTAVTDILPSVGAANTIYRIGKWNGTQYNNTVYSEYAWDGSSYVLLDVKEYGIDDEPTAGSDNFVKSGGVAEMYGEYAESIEFVRVVTDNEGNILYGVNVDGNFYFGTGCPQQVKDYIQQKINTIMGVGDVTEKIDTINEMINFFDGIKHDKTLQNLLQASATAVAAEQARAEAAEQALSTNKVDKEEGKSLIDFEYASSKSTIENQEFLEITTDNEDKILEGIQADGTKIIERDLHVKGDAKIEGNTKIEGNSEVLGDSKIFGNIEVSGISHKINESIEFVKLVTDANNNILYGITTDGDFVFGAGVPKSIKNYVLSQKIKVDADVLAEKTRAMAAENDLSTAIGNEVARATGVENTKVDKEEGESLIDAEYASSQSTIDNPEYLQVTTDSEDKVLEGIKQDGSKVIGGDLNVAGSANINDDVRILGDMEVSGVSYKVIENSEYFAAWVDSNDKVIFGLRTDGKTYIGDANFFNDIKNNQEAISEIKSYLNNIPSNIDWDALLSVTTIENPEFVDVKTDSEGKILAGRTSNGAAFETVGFSTPKVSVDGATIENIEDIEGRTEIKTDSEGKIISYRDSDGVKHEEIGIDSAVVNTNSLNLTDEGMTEFQRALVLSGFHLKSVTDWSDEISLKLPSPKCAKINFIISHNYSDAQIQTFKDEDNWPNILLPTTKTMDLKCTAEYWDMLGNYFKKAAVLNAQGNSSMRYRVKNLTYDLDDGSEISFGGWVMQDSFHLKFYYQDFLKVYCIAGYRIGEELIKYKNCRSNRNKVGKNNSHWNFGATTDALENNVESGALCHPDGFGVEVYVNGEYQGLYILQLKKHRKNYDMDKKNYEEVLIDNLRSFTQPVWTDYEIKNPKTLICMDGTEYDDDAPKELIDSSSEFYDSTNKNHKNTVKTKNAILRLCSAMSTITSSDNPTEKFLEFFDKDMLEVYFILIQLLYGYDNRGGNWVWSCFNEIWAPNFYDMDTTCGKTSSGTIIATQSVTTWFQPNAETEPLGFVWANYKSEIVALWDELRDKKIIDADNLITFYEKITHDIGISSYERQYKKYPTLPSYRNSTFDDKVVLSDTTQVKRSDYWEVVREVQDWNEDPTDFDDTKMYVVGDTCKVHVGLYNHIIFKCKQDIPEAGLAPMTFNTYIDLPGEGRISGGFYDSLNRIKKWFEERITFLDSQFIN